MQKKTERTPVYWDGILDLINDENKAYRTLVEKLESREYKSVKIELKITSGKYPVYGMYQDDTIRVLSTQIEVDKKKYLILVELMLDHDYKDNPFMQDKVRDAYMDRHYGSFAAYIRREEKKRAETDTSRGKEERSAAFYKPVMLHHNKVISLSIQQAEQLNKPDRTLLIEGGPGSGKTVLALALLATQLRRFTGSTMPETLVYITQSAALTRKTAKQWEQQSHHNPYGKQVLFCTYDEIVKRKLGLGDENIVGEERFLNWMEKTHLTRDENKKHPEIRALIDQHGKKKLAALLYKEFRILSGYDRSQYASREHASTLPSLFPDVELRAWIVEAYEKYIKLLAAEHKYDTALIAPDALSGIAFDYVVLDEAQDLSYGQLKAVHNWRGNKNLAVLKDENQNVYGDESNTDYLRSLVKSNDCQRVLLKGSFRCPIQVIHFANQVLALKFFLTRGIKIKLQQNQIELTKEQKVEAQQGTAVQWVDKLDDIKNKDELIKKINESADVLVVTSARFKETAQKIFNKGIVISIDDIYQVKGLQFSQVVLYQILDDEIYAKANAEPELPRGAEILNAEVPQHRAKEGQERPEYAPPFDKLFVALTRCAGEEDGSGQVLVIQKRDHKQKDLVDFLKTRTFGAAVEPKPASVVVDVSQLKKNTEANWLEQAQTALENNNSAFALFIFKSKLNKTEAQFKEWQKSVEDEKTPLTTQDKKKDITKSPTPVAPAKAIKRKIMTTKEAVNKAVDEKNVVLLTKLFRKEYPTSDAEVSYQQLLGYLFDNEDSVYFLYQALTNNAFYREFLTNPDIPNMLCEVTESTGNPVFYHFVTDYAESLGIFEKLISNQSFLNRLASANKLADVLLTNCRQRRLSNSLVSTFVFMGSYVNWIRPLSRLLSNQTLLNSIVVHPDFLTQFASPVISNKGPYPEPVLANVMLKSDELPILYYLFGHEDFYQRVFASDLMIRTLCSIYTHNNAYKVRSSPLYWLIVNASEEARQFALKLGNDVKVLTKLCDTDDFYTALLARIHPQSEGTMQFKEEQTSALYWIHRASRFRDLRKNLYKIPGFLQKLVEHKEYINALVMRRLPAADEDYNDSTLNLIINSDKELINATLAHPLVSDRLLSDQRFYDAICARLTKQSGALKNTSLLCKLLLLANNDELITRLFQHPLFIDKLQSTTEFIPTLLTSLHFGNTKANPPSLLFEMIRVPKNNKVFIKLLKNAEFREQLLNHDDFVDALTNCIRDKNHDFNQITPLYLLCLIKEEHYNGIDFLLDWCTENTFYNRLVTSKKLIQALFLINPSDADVNKLCPFQILLSHPRGAKLLGRMYNHPEFNANLRSSSHVPPELLEKFKATVLEHGKTAKPEVYIGLTKQEGLPKVAENIHTIFAPGQLPTKTEENSTEKMQPS